MEVIIFVVGIFVGILIARIFGIRSEKKKYKIGFHLPDDYYDNEEYNSDYENK